MFVLSLATLHYITSHYITMHYKFYGSFKNPNILFFGWLSLRGCTGLVWLLLNDALTSIICFIFVSLALKVFEPVSFFFTSPLNTLQRRTETYVWRTKRVLNWIWHFNTSRWKARKGTLCFSSKCLSLPTRRQSIGIRVCRYSLSHTAVASWQPGYQKKEEWLVTLIHATREISVPLSNDGVRLPGMAKENGRRICVWIYHVKTLEESSRLCMNLDGTGPTYLNIFISFKSIGFVF